MVDTIAAVEDNPVVELGYSNYKAPELVALLVRPPTPEAMARVEAVCAAHAEHLNFMEDGIGCRTHWADIDWALPVRRDIPTRKPGWLAQFRARFRRR